MHRSAVDAHVEEGAVGVGGRHALHVPAVEREHGTVVVAHEHAEQVRRGEHGFAKRGRSTNVRENVLISSIAGLSDSFILILPL